MPNIDKLHSPIAATWDYNDEYITIDEEGGGIYTIHAIKKSLYPITIKGSSIDFPNLYDEKIF